LYSPVSEIEPPVVARITREPGVRSTAAVNCGSSPTEFALLGLDAVVADMAAGLRATAASRAGDAGHALAQAESMTLAGWYHFAVGSPSLARSAERWLRTELLREAGRDRDASSAYAAFHAFSPRELPYLAPSQLRRAEILDRLGEHRAAAIHYAGFPELWRDADVMLRADVDRARRRAVQPGG
jgi:hypothetical protein